MAGYFHPIYAVSYLDVSNKMASVVVNALGELRDDDESGEVLPELSCMCFDTLHSTICDEEVLEQFFTDCRDRTGHYVDIMERMA